jgi:heme A synthase
MMIGITHLHTTLRYAVVVALLLTLIQALMAKNGKKTFSKGLDRLTLMSMILVHIQLLLGLFLYFTSGKVLFTDMAIVMKNPILRFFTVEHILGMLIAITLITIGRVKLKKIPQDAAKLITYYGFTELDF